MRQLNINFDYFKLTILELNKEKNSAVEKVLDLDGFFHNLIKKHSNLGKNTLLPCMGEEARIQKLVGVSIFTIEKDDVDNIKFKKYWIGEILRLRERNIFTGVASEDGDFTTLELGDKRKIGESATFLYDVDTKELIFQRNKNSLTPSGLEEYFKRVFKGSDIIIKPIILKDIDMDKIKKAKYHRKLEIGVIVNEENCEEKDSLIGFLKKFGNEDNLDIRMSISVGQGAKKDAKIGRNLVESSIKELYENGNTSQFKINYKSDINTSVERVDLLDNRKSKIISISKKKGESIMHEDVVPKLFEKISKNTDK